MGTNPLSVIDRYYAELNDTERQIADWIRANTMDASRLPIDFIAKEIGVSKSTIVRFTQKIGYSGFAEFKAQLARLVLSHQEDVDEQGLPKRAANLITETYVGYLRQLAETLVDEDVETAACLICEADRIVIAGYNRTFHSASQLYRRLFNVGIRSESTSELGVLANISNLYCKDDLLVIFTIADTMKMMGPLVKEFSQTGMRIVCITMAPALPFKRYCDLYISLPRISRDPNVVFLDDQAIFFVFIEILIDAIAKRKGRE